MSLLLWTRVAHFGGFSTLERTGAKGETVVNSFCSGFMDGMDGCPNASELGGRGVVLL